MSIESQVYELLQGQLNGAELIAALNDIAGIEEIEYTSTHEGEKLATWALLGTGENIAQFKSLVSDPKGFKAFLQAQAANDKLGNLLASNIGGDVTGPMMVLYGFVAMEHGWFNNFVGLERVDKAAITATTQVPFIQETLLTIALATGNIGSFVHNSTHLDMGTFMESFKLQMVENDLVDTAERQIIPPEEIISYHQFALMSLTPDALAEFFGVLEPGYGKVDFSGDNEGFNGLLDLAAGIGQVGALWKSCPEEQRVKLAAKALEEGCFDDRFVQDSECQGQIPIDAGDHQVSLVSLALSGIGRDPAKFGEFLKVAAGNMDYMAMIHGKDGVQVPLVLPLLAFGKFAEFNESGHGTGIVDIGNAAWGAKIISMCVQGGGMPQWDALVGSDKLAGMLENFNALVPFQDHEAPLVYVMAQNGMLDKVLSYLTEEGQLEWKADIDGDGTERGADVGKVKHFENELDLGAKTYPGTAKKQILQIGDGEPVEVTPLLMYQVPTTSNLIGAMAAQGKLVMTLSGDVFDSAVKCMLSTDLVKSGKVWFKAVIYSHQPDAPQEEAMLEVAALVSGGPKESAHSGKLVYGVMPENILSGCIDACKGSTIKSADSEGPMSVNPFDPSTFFWLKPFEASAAQAVDKEYLMAHQVLEEAAELLLGKTDYTEGMLAHYWEHG